MRPHLGSSSGLQFQASGGSLEVQVRANAYASAEPSPLRVTVMSLVWLLKEYNDRWREERQNTVAIAIKMFLQPAGRGVASKLLRSPPPPF